MLVRLFLYLRCSPLQRAAQTARRRVAFALLAIGAASGAHAGSDEVPRPSRATLRTMIVKTEIAPVATPKPVISKAPHLVAIGPMEIAIQPVAGPRRRQPPLLPTARATKVEAIAEPAPTTGAEPERKNAPEPSALSPDAAPTLLPSEKAAEPSAPATSAPASAIKDEASTPALVPTIPREPELKDAVIFFETPVNSTGSQISIPALAPLSSPASAPQPESRAIYRKEKE